MWNKKTKYALKALSYIGSRYDSEKRVLSKDIAEKHGISVKFLEAILLELRNAGILSSRKGKGGGYYLLKPPSEIPLSKIIRLTDGPISVVPCTSLFFYERCSDCAAENDCKIRETAIAIRDCTLAILDTKTLADVIAETDV
ncbi:MAG: Rrf2 family transcriptional regulator [Saprospiraceae bacterium]|jgi:Rrf2 family protein|nr:Rrf2 family transcriptional regulator [Saprospiraceae bacterium]